MLSNKISATITPTDHENIAKAVESIKTVLPFLVSLTPDEIQAIPKMGTRSQGFVDKALEVATQNPEIMPRGFDIDEMRKDVETYRALTTIRLLLVQLLEMIESTQTQIGSEAYSAALAVYAHAKLTGKGLGLETVVDELGKRFSRALKVKPDTPNIPPIK